MNQIGHLTLNISMMIYLIWFLPQLFLNFKKKNTAGLSLFMHVILCSAYLCDMIYGFGLNMPWQYKMVTIIGLTSLAIQHYQFGSYGCHTMKEKNFYIFFTLMFLLLFIFAIWIIKQNSQERIFFDTAGMIANIFWLSYMMPQIYKNFCNQSTAGLSPYFVLLAIFLNLCDTTSAWTLGWDYPSKIGQSIGLMGNSILFFQVFYYGFHSRLRLATHREW